MNEPRPAVKIALFTGGIDKHYAAGLCRSLASLGIAVDVIGNREMAAELKEWKLPNLEVLPLYASLSESRSRLQKLLACARVYGRLIRYATTTSAPVFHTLWNYKLPLLDRTILLLYCRLLRKRLLFTAHNINAAERDGHDSLLNRLSLRVQYRLVDGIFVHTEKMKEQLVQLFGVQTEKITVIPFGTYSMVPQTTLTAAEAKQRLGLGPTDRAILFFGRITPYKGIDLLAEAFERVARSNPNYRLVIAGEVMKEAEPLWRRVQQAIAESPARGQVLEHVRFIPDSEIELYLKGADVLVLPYTEIFQSGVLFMSWSFGLPVIATDVGSFRRDIDPGVTGYVCRSGDPADLAASIDTYFASDLYRNLAEQRVRIKESIQASHSWEIAAGKTAEVYGRLTAARELQYGA